MSIKVQSLGSVAATGRCLQISTTTNATPIVATLAAGHGLKDGDRIAIAGITGNTGANGVWTLQFTGANTARLLGSVGNGVHGGTAVVGVVCDRTPFMRNHAAALSFPGAAAVATVVVEAYANYADFALATRANAGAAIAPVLDPSVTNTNGNSTTTPASSTITNPVLDYEVFMPYILSANVSAYTSGTVAPRLKA
jgi:hypothetical protein